MKRGLTQRKMATDAYAVNLAAGLANLAIALCRSVSGAPYNAEVDYSTRGAYEMRSLNEAAE